LQAAHVPGVAAPATLGTDAISTAVSDGSAISSSAVDMQHVQIALSLDDVGFKAFVKNYIRKDRSLDTAVTMYLSNRRTPVRFTTISTLLLWRGELALFLWLHFADFIAVYHCDRTNFRVLAFNAGIVRSIRRQNNHTLDGLQGRNK